jgi:two-component system, NtrC family, sensor histidine kinase PilS
LDADDVTPPLGTPIPPLRDFTPARIPRREELLRRMDDPKSPWAVAALRRKLLWLSWLRIVTLLVLVTATAVFSGGTGLSLMELVRGTLMWVGLFWLVPAALYFPVLLAVQTRAGLLALALAQMVQDVLLSAIVVASTGGTGSAFTFFFSLNIVVAGIVLGRPGTAAGIASSGLMMGLIAAMETGAVGLPWFLTDVLARGSWSAVQYSLLLNAVAFVSIGILSSYLAEQLRRSDVQRERYRATLEDLRQLHESILASVDAGIVTCRLDDRILHVNRAAEDLLGLDMKRSKGRDLFELLPDLRDPLARYQGPFEVRRVSPGGEPLFLKISVTPLMDRAGERIGRILDVSDVTTVKRLEQQMKADERLATIGKLSAVVAHEIRNPLAAISASAQMLSMTGGLGPDDRRAADIVVRETDRLNEWITELLDYARPRKGDVGPVDVTELLRQVAEVVRGDPAASRLDVLLDAEPGLSLVGDRQRLHRAFLNLCKNSVEAMSDGGQLVLRARAESEGGRKWVVVRIIDNGCGIPQEELQRIFDAFYTTKPRGTGLGLATVLQIVDEMGGQVNVASVPYVRTEFEIRLRA